MAALPVNIRRILEEALKESIAIVGNGAVFRKNAFFDRWFKTLGTPYLFLFKKNLHVTNMQLAELAALIKSMTNDDSGEKVDLQFAAPSTFITSLDSLLDAFLRHGKKDIDSAVRLIAELYSDIVRRIIVMSPHFGSCEVFLPANLSLDLGLLCGYSGYVHSCGYNVYLRNTIKASYESLRESLLHHLTSRVTSPQAVRLIAYSHEDFSPSDSEKRRHNRLAHGLEEDKLHIEKMYLGDERLVSALLKLRTDPALRDRIEIPRGEGRIPESGETSKAHTLFLIRDYSIGGRPWFRGDDVYLILYDQLFKNTNQFHYFDENKPAWVTHTTTPHTLMGAMINLTRPDWTERVRICDPFVGTGTSTLEALKFANVKVFGRDSSPLVRLVTEDNRLLFAATLGELEEYKAFLHGATARRPGFVLKRLSPDFFSTLIPVQDTFFEIFAKEGVISFERVESDEARERELAATLSTSNKMERLLFYLLLKTLRRNEGALHRETLEQEWEQRFLAEVEQLARDIEVLIALYSRETVQGHDKIVMVQGDYSLACMIEPRTFRECGERCEILVKEVAALEEYAYDVVIADPPYGFNTEESIEGLARLYNTLVRKLVEALSKEGGQLVITLPERSYIGRRSLFFTHKEIVGQSILREARRRDLEMIKASAPEPGSLFRPPYYWRAERALSRSILHYRFRPRKAP